MKASLSQASFQGNSFQGERQTLAYANRPDLSLCTLSGQVPSGAGRLDRQGLARGEAGRFARGPKKAKICHGETCWKPKGSLKRARCYHAESFLVAHGRVFAWESTEV